MRPSRTLASRSTRRRTGRIQYPWPTGPDREVPPWDSSLTRQLVAVAAVTVPAPGARAPTPAPTPAPAPVRAPAPVTERPVSLSLGSRGPSLLAAAHAPAVPLGLILQAFWP